MVKKLKLTKGYEALVDDDDYERLIKFKWRCGVTAKCGNVILRPVRSIKKGPGKYSSRHLHHEVMNFEPVYPKTDLLVDHINRDRLDNRKENLRIVTQKQNMENCRQAENAVGIHYDKVNKKYYARWRGKFLGRFLTYEEAENVVRIHREI